MTNWREKNDQELTKDDIREMRAAALRLPRRVVELQNETVNERNEWRNRAIAAEAQVLVLAKALYGPEFERRHRQAVDQLDADEAAIVRDAMVDEARARAAQMMENPRETQAWRDGAMLLGLASEVAALRAGEPDPMPFGEASLPEFVTPPGLASEVSALRAAPLRQCPLCTEWLAREEFDDDNLSLIHISEPTRH